MSRSRTCCSRRFISSGGRSCPRAAKLDLMLTIASSNWLRLTSTFLPLATASSGNRSEILGAGLAGAAVSAGAGAAARQRSSVREPQASATAKNKVVRFINQSAQGSISLEFDHINIADIGIFLQLV